MNYKYNCSYSSHVYLHVWCSKGEVRVLCSLYLQYSILAWHALSVCGTLALMSLPPFQQSSLMYIYEDNIENMCMNAVYFNMHKITDTPSTEQRSIHSWPFKTSCVTGFEDKVWMVSPPMEKLSSTNSRCTPLSNSETSTDGRDDAGSHVLLAVVLPIVTT